jgi:hypothetical protein
MPPLLGFQAFYAQPCVRQADALTLAIALE